MRRDGYAGPLGFTDTLPKADMCLFDSPRPDPGESPAHCVLKGKPIPGRVSGGYTINNAEHLNTMDATSPHPPFRGPGSTAAGMPFPWFLHKCLVVRLARRFPFRILHCMRRAALLRAAE